MPLISRLLSQTKREKTGQKGCDQLSDQLLTRKEQEGWPRRHQLVECFPKQKWRKQERKAANRSMNWSLARKGTETGKGGQDMVNWPTVLPKMKGRRQKTKTTGCNQLLNRFVAKKPTCNNKKWFVSDSKIEEDLKLLNFSANVACQIQAYLAWFSWT